MSREICSWLKIIAQKLRIIIELLEDIKKDKDGNILVSQKKKC